VTCQSISGHRLFHGHASRPNYLTWGITINGASYSKDMAQRTIVILLSRPAMVTTWERDIAKFIETQRDEIVADIRWHLAQSKKKIPPPKRWAMWYSEILSRLEAPDEVMALLDKRRDEIDEDDLDAEAMVEHFRACLQSHVSRANPDTNRFRIPTLLASKWACLLRSQFTDRQAAQYLRQLSHPCLRYVRSPFRGYLWTGARAKQGVEPLTLKYTVFKT